MPFNFQFRLAEERKDIEKLVSFILKQPLDYPHYEDWVEKVRQELLIEDKKCILAFTDGYLVGDLIYQQHRQFPRIREMKNMRIHYKVQRRYFGQFMIRQAEEEDKKSYDAIVCDTRSDRTDILKLLIFMGYERLLTIPLYDEHKEDVVMVKSFKRTSEGLFVQLKEKISRDAY